MVRFGVVLALFLSVPAVGLAEGVSNFAGIAVGSNDYQIDVAGGDDFDEGDTAYQVHGGIFLNENLGFQLAYLDLGDAEDGDAEVSADGFEASIIGRVPLFSVVALRARLGYFIWDADFDDGVDSGSEDGTDVNYAVGFDARFGRLISGFVEYRDGALDEVETETVQLGLSFRFGVDHGDEHPGDEHPGDEHPGDDAE